MGAKEVSVSSTCKCVTIFGLWTVTSFLCHYTAKLFLTSEHSEGNNGSYGFLKSFALTVYQTFMCYSITEVRLRKDKIFLTISICHFLATLSTNYSMAMMYASSTFVIKLMEPITSACIQRCLIAVPLHSSVFVSLPLIVGGACMFNGNPLTDKSITTGTIMAFSSNIILAVRNVAIKTDHNQSVGLTLRSYSSISCVIVSHVVFIPCLYFLESRGIVDSGITYLIICGLTSSVFHVSYSYISTNIVLRYMTVLSHSVCNIMKRVLVVLMLYFMGNRYAQFNNFIGLAICTAGLFIYVAFKASTNTNIKDFPSKDQVKPDKRLLKIASLIFICACVGAFGSFSNINLKLAVKSSSLLQFESRSFGAKSLQIMDDADLEPTFDDDQFEDIPRFKRFIRTKLIQSPQQTDLLSPHLKTSTEVIREAQRIHFNLFADLLRGFRYAMLFDVAAFENKGDPAISSGEIYLLRRLGIDLIYYCSFSYCVDRNLNYARDMSRIYTEKELVILVHGGGNIVGYAYNDIIRFKLFELFRGFKILVFPQSVYLKKYNQHFDRCKQQYCCNKNLTLVLRDRLSLSIAQKYFNNGTNLVMAPDMAFQIGRVKRYMAPMYDIIWLKRQDDESSKYRIPALPKGVSVKISDWWGWQTPKGETSLENAFLIATNGMVFVQRGRVVITDRLHGHILCTLLDIPHVLIDNPFKKLSSYHKTWTKGVKNTRITADATEAVALALELLEIYKNEIPPVAPYMNVVEHPFENKQGRPITPEVPTVFNESHRKDRQNTLPIL